VRLLGRILVIVLAFLVASLAAALVLAVGMVAGDWADLLAIAADTFGLTIVVGFATASISALALLPMLIVVAIAESLALRSVLIYTLVGLAIGAFYGFSLLDQVTPSGLREFEVTAAAGITGGLVYWALAGRNAGRWRETGAPAR
jgi:hypothetical protein